MKIFSQIRYVLFAIMVVGCFASFAKNEYGMDIFYHSCFFVGLTLLIEAFVSLFDKNIKNKLLVFYLFSESILLGLLFISFDMKNMHLPYTGPVMVLSSWLISVLYLLFGIRNFIKEFKIGKRASIAVFFVVLGAITAINWQIFKTMHWPGSGVLLWTACSISTVNFIYILFRIKYFYKVEKITLGTRMNLLPGKLRMTFYFFSILTVYICLIVFGFAPDFYLLRVPTAMHKLNEENNPKGWVYGQNYDTFVQNRITAEESK